MAGMKQILLMIAVVALMGCESTPASRMVQLHKVFDPIIGLSHTQMVNKLGPPEKIEQLDDGTSVATYRASVPLWRFEGPQGVKTKMTVYVYLDKNRIATKWNIPRH